MRASEREASGSAPRWPDWPPRVECRLDVADGAVLCPRDEGWVERHRCDACPFLERLEQRYGRTIVVCAPEVADLELAAALNVAGGSVRRVA